MKNLLTFLPVLYTNDTLKARCVTSTYVDVMFDMMNNLGGKSAEETEWSIERMKYYYLGGVTFKELGELTGRKTQSIARTLFPHLTAEDKERNHAIRKDWKALMNYYEYVYKTDEYGSFDYLHARFPDKTERQIKAMYRTRGGQMLFEKKKAQQQEQIRRIELLRQNNVSVQVISEILNVPPPTVYKRLAETEELSATK